MWRQLGEQGFWEGEIWNRRKDGNIYPEWLAIRALRDEAGVVGNYVGTFVDLSGRKQAEARIERLAYYDQLTGLCNRTLFLDRLDQALAEARRENHHLALMFLDLDHFKEINDTLGHDTGDALLVEVSKRMEACLRGNDTAARLGGDEFVVLLPRLDPEQEISATQAEAVAKKVLTALRRPYDLGGHQLPVSASVGIALYPVDASSTQELIQFADTAMYQAKDAGRDTIRFFSRELHGQMINRRQIEEALHSALANGEFSLAYQPQVQLTTGRITGAEALLRWDSATLGAVSPAEFIPVAEETGLIIEIGAWVLKEVIALKRRWCENGLCRRHGFVSLSANVSYRQLLTGKLPTRFEAMLTDSGLDSGCIELEITESGIMDHLAAACSQLDEIRRIGARLAIDDFGTGHSSLARLKRLPLDIIKIDQSFIRDFLDDPNDRAIVRATIDVSHVMGLEVIAEGVEEEDQYQQLKELGCDYIQGYYFGRPMSEDALAELIHQHNGEIAGG